MATQLSLSLNLNNMFLGFVADNTKKVCNVCRERKEGWQFPKDKRTKDGHSHTCRECQRKMKMFNK